jgi:hypothetical protein
MEQYINTIDKKINNDFKQDIWDIKQSIKQISQNEKDIAILLEKSESNTELLKSTKETLEAKMVTKDYLDNRKYKDWRLWLVVIGLISALVMPFVKDKLFNKTLIKNNTNAGTTHVSSNNKK